MVAAVGEESVPMEHPPLSDRTKDKPGDELADSEQATLATTLAMLAHGSNPGYMLAQLQQHDTAECTETSDDRQLLAKRDGSTAGLSDLRDSSKQQRFGDAEDSGTPPDSPLSATAAAAAAAGLHKLSSASAVGFDAALGSFAVSEDGIQHVGHPHSGDGLDHIAVAGGGNPKSTPIQIMQQLVDCGILPSCGPETHCYVKCGMVQGVFSLASGTILCLCDACSENGQGEPTWFAPAAFERHGGMAASKKWRGSIQVKGLPQRKTLGQWLDERGVTAKPRLTLADQVQQVGGSRQRSGSHVAPGRVPTSGSELAAAAANAARLAGLGRTAVGNGGSRTPVSQENGLIVPAAAMDVDGLEVYSSAGLQQTEPIAVASAGLPQFEMVTQPQVYVPVPVETIPPPPPAAAAATMAPAAEQPGHPSSGWVAKLKHLLAELAAADSPAASTAPASAVQASELMNQQEEMRQQQQPQVTLLQQLQQLRREQPPYIAAGLAPAPPAPPAPAALAEDSLIRLARLLPGVVPASTIGPAGMSEPAISALVAAPALALSAQPTSPTTGTAQVVSPAIKPEVAPQASALAPVVALPRASLSPGPAGSDGAEGQQSINLLLTLATGKAVTEPMESFRLLSQALQQLLRQHGDTCNEAAAAASAAVAAAGEKVCGKNGNSSTVSAAAAFAAIAAAAAAAAAALAGQCQQQAAVQQTVGEQSVQSQVQRQEVAVISPRFHQQQHLQHLQELVAPQPAPDQHATAAAVAAVQDILSARGVAARSVAQLMAGVLANPDPVPQQLPQQAQQVPSDAYNTLLNAFMREFGGAVVVGR